MSGTAISIVVAIIAAAGSCIGSLISARATRSAVLQQMQVQQAIQNERQRVTDDKIDKLSERMDAQAAFGTEIAVLKAEQRQLRADLEKIKEA